MAQKSNFFKRYVNSKIKKFIIIINQFGSKKSRKNDLFRRYINQI